MDKDDDNEPLYVEEFCTFCKVVVTHVLVEEQINGVLHRKGQCFQCSTKRNLPHQVAPEDARIYFGIHKGKKLSEIPGGYLKWLLSEVKLNYIMRKRIEIILSK